METSALYYIFISFEAASRYNLQPLRYSEKAHVDSCVRNGSDTAAQQRMFYFVLFLFFQVEQDKTKYYI